MTTYEFEHTLTTTATPAAIWAKWSDPADWPSWDEGLEKVTLEGGFVEGARGELTVAGQPPLGYVLTEVRPNEAFTDETAMPGGVLRFIHRIEPAGDGRWALTHRLEIEGDDLAALGPVITEDFPVAMAALATMCE
ncbi:SRPBCC family protein [Kutzneria buriramensis]|uniref:Polyketide cyclase/dehydrase/lipid transport protein n=1 Tax=Kutzneria buriramensis TaxID=1045776 RepID=A0A3E0HBP4_9PSEU|nr:SRPBCC family protein [Kutzneria buriramensis]REH41824.1 polyketide cyclase/dehydrase/lipid transport protein [Kutzneria buriramensis]